MLSPTNQSFPATSSTGNVTVTAQGGCTWAATSNAAWLTITSGGSGSGNGTVAFTIAANTSASQRTGTITVTGQTFTVTQAGATTINVGVSLSTTLAAASGSTLSVPILVEDVTGKGVTAYDFTLGFDPAVLQLQSTAIDAAGTLSSGFSLTPNAATPGRLIVSAFGTTALSGAGTLLKLNFTVVGPAGSSTPLTWQAFRFNEGLPAATTTNGRFTVSGNLPPTLATLSPNTATAGSTGLTLTMNGSGFVNGAVVRWNNNDRTTAFVSPTQLTATIPASDLVNPGTINVAAVNPGSAPSNALPFTITPCSYAIAPTAMSFDRNSNNGAVTVTTGALCPWTAVSNVSWLTITSGASGTGNGMVNYVVAANIGAARTGTLTIAGQTFTVNQAGNSCAGLTITLAPATLPDGLGGVAYNQTLTASGGAGPYSFTVTGGALPNGLTLTSGGALSGTPTVAGTFNFTVTATDANGCMGNRNYTVAVTVSCNLVLTPTSQTFTNMGGDGSITITTGDRCVWVSLEDVTWIEILTSKSGVGSDTLRYRVSANPGTARTGTITFNGQPFTVTQMGVDIPTLACVNAASYQPNAPLAPDSIVSAFGQDLSNVDAGQTAPPGPLPTVLNGTTVKVRDSAGIERLAPLFFVGKTQVNFLMPTGTAVGTATVTITNGAGKVALTTVTIAMVAPGIFSANADGRGTVVGTAVRVKNGNIIANEPLAMFDAVRQRFVGVPLEVGQPDERVVLQIYGTGIRYRSDLANVIVTIGGVRATVDFAGAQPSFVGLDQLNIPVPASLAGRGEVDIVIVVDGQIANVVTLTIK